MWKNPNTSEIGWYDRELQLKVDGFFNHLPDEEKFVIRLMHPSLMDWYNQQLINTQKNKQMYWRYQRYLFSEMRKKCVE